MEEQFIRDRITKLRMDKNISERRMSEDMGHSGSYIHSIASGRAMPSMGEFLYICEYLGVTPMEFFDEKRQPSLIQLKAIDAICAMSDEDVQFLLGFMERMK